MVTLVAPLLAAVLSLPEKGSPTPAKDIFSLGVEILSTMESGPLVVKLTLRYRGAKWINVRPDSAAYWLPHYTPLDRFHAPRHWKARERPAFIHLSGVSIISGKGGPAPDRFQPGTIRSVVYYLHHDYERISPGPERLRLSGRFTLLTGELSRVVKKKSLKAISSENPQLPSPLTSRRPLLRASARSDSNLSGNRLLAPFSLRGASFTAIPDMSKQSTLLKRSATVLTRGCSPWSLS